MQIVLLKVEGGMAVFSFITKTTLLAAVERA